MYSEGRAREGTSFRWRPSGLAQRRRPPIPRRYPFTLTARVESFIVGRPDLHDTIAQLQDFQEAGAHVLYASGLKTREAIVAVVGSVDCPVNLIMGQQGVQLNLTSFRRWK